MSVSAANRPVVLGVLAASGGAIIALAATGTTWAFSLLVVSGFGGAVLSGWLGFNGGQQPGVVASGIHHGVLVAGTFGLLVYLSFLTRIGGVASRAYLLGATGGPRFVLIASPLAIVFFGLIGAIGGAVGSRTRGQFETRRVDDGSD